MRTSKDIFDERQIIERGKAFQIGFFTAIFASLAVFLMTSVFEIRMEAMTIFMLQTSVPVMVCMMALILKNAYDPVNKQSGRILCTIYSLVGLFLIIFTVARVVSGKDSFVTDGIITNECGYVILGFTMANIGIVHLIRQYLNKKQLTEE